MSTTRQKQRIEHGSNNSTDNIRGQRKSFENLKNNISLHVQVKDNNMEGGGADPGKGSCSGENSPRLTHSSGFDTDSINSGSDNRFEEFETSKPTTYKEGTSTSQSSETVGQTSSTLSTDKEAGSSENITEERKSSEISSSQKQNCYYANLPKNYFGSHISLWENDYRGGLASSSYTSRALEHLKRKSLHEVWGVQGNGFSPDYTLRMYLDLTFRRVHYLGQILGYWVQDSSRKRTKSDSKPVILLWDTGLISKSMQPLYCIMIPFNKLPRHEVPNQYNARWCIRYFQVPSKFAGNEKKEQFHRILGKEFYDEFQITEGVKRSILPKPASYFLDVVDVPSIIYDSRVTVEKSTLSTEYSKSVLSKACLPKKLQGFSWGEIEQKMKIGIAETLALLQRDYRMAIPVGIPFIDTNRYKDILNQKPKERDFYFYDAFDSGGKLEIQLLVPLCTMKRVYSPDCAVTLKYVPGKNAVSDNSQKPGRKKVTKPHYEVTHIMSIDQAYILARRHQHIDQLWLMQNPTYAPQTQNQVQSTTTVLPQSGGYYPSYYPVSTIPESSTAPVMFTSGSTIPISMVYTPYYQYGTGSMSHEVSATIQTGEGLPSNYKTSLCSSYKLYGYCPYSTMCHFAHGVHELRSVPEESSSGSLGESE